MRLTFRALAKAFLALLPPFFFSLPAICSGDQKCLSWRSTFALSVPLILRWYCLAFFFLATCLRCADGPRYTPSASVLSSSSLHTLERCMPNALPHSLWFFPALRSAASSTLKSRVNCMCDIPVCG